MCPCDFSYGAVVLLVLNFGLLSPLPEDLKPLAFLKQLFEQDSDEIVGKTGKKVLVSEEVEQSLYAQEEALGKKLAEILAAQELLAQEQGKMNKRLNMLVREEKAKANQRKALLKTLGAVLVCALTLAVHGLD